MVFCTLIERDISREKGMGFALPQLKKYRETEGFTQDALAIASGVSRATIARVERGDNCNRRNMIRLAAALGVEADMLRKQDAVQEINEWDDEIPSLSLIASSVTKGMNYNPEQQRAIEHPPTNLAILAGAGAGKTAVMSERVSVLIRTYGISPSNIVVLTFTEKAAKEVEQRIRFTYRKQQGHEQNLDHMFTGTIHAFCLELLRQYLPDYLSYELLDGVGQFLFIQRHFHDIFPNGLPKHDGGYYKMPVAMRLAPQLLNLIREADIDFSQLEGHELLDCLSCYKNKLKEKRLMDFSGLLDIISQELSNNTKFKSALSEKLRYLIIDEYQDTNYIQEQLIKKIINLAPEKINLSVVGDDDQSIYGWNNADTNNILSFHKRYNDVKNIALTKNYRSKKHVLTCA